MKIVIMGAPSCGKGIQSKLIQEKFGYNNISTGQILRDFVNEGNKQSKKLKSIMNQGKFVSDSLMCKIVNDYFNKNGDEDYILDGFPRTVKQVKFLIKYHCPDIVLFLQTDKDNAISRVEDRVVCPTCRRSYSKKNLKNLICPEDNTKLIKREDDNLSTYSKRYDIFEKETKPVLEVFNKKGLLKIIQNNGTIEDTFENISKLIGEKVNYND